MSVVGGAVPDRSPAFAGRPGTTEDLGPADLLAVALAQIATLHEEVGRLSGGGAGDPSLAGRVRELEQYADEVDRWARTTRRDRLRSVWRRWRGGTLGPAAALRTVAWVLLRRAAPPARPAAPGRVPVASRYRGDSLVRTLMRAGELDQAHVAAMALTPRHGTNLNFLRLHRDLEVLRGNVSAVLALTRQIERRDTTVTPASVRKLEGRVRELSGWYPRIAGPPTPVVPRSSTVVLHLLKESRPSLSNGFTSRSHHNLLSEAAAGFEPVVVTEPGHPVGEATLEDWTETVGGIVHHRLAGGTSDAGSWAPDTWLQLFADKAYRVVQAERPALLHASSGRRGYDTALVAMALKEKTGLPFVYEVRSFFEGTWTPDRRQETRGETYRARLAVEQMCMDAADAIITLGTAMRDELVSRGVPEAKITIVPNGIDPDLFDSPPPRDASERPRTFGYVSNMDHYRESQETLVEACALLRGTEHEMRCLLVGDGPRRTELEALARRLRVTDLVELTGAVDHLVVPSMYARIDVFVVPRVDERAATYVTPLKPYEAMAMGVPLVVSDLPALREVVDPPVRGLTFAAGDAADLAAVLRGIVDDPAPALARAAEARRWVLAERRWEQNGARYRAVYEQVLARVPGQGVPA